MFMKMLDDLLHIQLMVYINLAELYALGFNLAMTLIFSNSAVTMFKVTAQLKCIIFNFSSPSGKISTLQN